MHQDEDYRIRRLLHSVRQRARTLGVPFDLTHEWVKEKFKVGVCEVSGLPLDLTSEGSVGERAWGPSLDREVPSLGYTQENTRVVCWIYNRAKGASDHDSVITLARALVANDN